MSAIRTVTSDTAQGSQPPLKTLHNVSTTDVQLELGQLQKNIPGNQQCRKIQKQGKKQSTAKQTLLGKKIITLSLQLCVQVKMSGYWYYTEE